jgi:Methyltransferase domain
LMIDSFAEFTANMERLELTGAVTVYKALSVDAAKQYDGPPIGLLFIDGSHKTDAVLDDVTSWQPHLAPDPVIVFDDYELYDVGVAIAQVRPTLPSAVGSVGKDLVFGPPGIRDHPRLRALFAARVPPRLPPELI